MQLFRSHQHDLAVTSGQAGLSVLIGLTLFYAGVKLDREAVPFDVVARIYGVTVGLGIVAVSLGALLLFLIELNGPPVPEQPEILLTALSAGLATGAPLGFYYHQLESRNAELQDRYREIEQLNRHVSIIQRVLRHNLKNELSIAMGVSESVVERVDPAERKRLRTALSHQERLVELAETADTIHDVLKTDRRTELDLVELVDAVVREARAESPAASIATDLPDELAVCGHPMFEEAVSEAVHNAIEHNDEGVEVGIRASARSEPEPVARLEVADTGSGIPDGEILPLRTREETPLEHGTGLGLRLIQTLVARSNGTLTFEENSPRGTVVVIELPRAGGSDRR